MLQNPNHELVLYSNNSDNIMKCQHISLYVGGRFFFTLFTCRRVRVRSLCGLDNFLDIHMKPCNLKCARRTVRALVSTTYSPIIRQCVVRNFFPKQQLKYALGTLNDPDGRFELK